MPAQMRGASSRQALDILQKVVWNERTQVERKNRLFVSMPYGISTAIRRRRTVVRRFFSALEPSFCTPAVRRIFSKSVFFAVCRAAQFRMAVFPFCHAKPCLCRL